MERKEKVVRRRGRPKKPESSQTTKADTTKKRKPKWWSKYGAFHPGKLPLWWISRAASLKGNALYVGMYLGVRRGTRSKAISPNLGRIPNLAKTGASRAVKALEQAGLIRVDRAPGRKLSIEILDQEPPPGLDVEQYGGKWPEEK